MSNALVDEGFRERICEWLRANGIDPGAIPIDAVATLDGDRLTVETYVPGAGWRPRRVVTHAITVPPPADVANWIRR